MYLNVRINPEDLDELTVDFPAFDFTYNGVRQSALPVERCCFGSVDAFKGLLDGVYNNNVFEKLVSAYICTNDKDEQILVVDIGCKSSTAPLFEFFKKNGIFISALRVFYNTATNCMHVSTKFCKDLSKLPDSMQRAVVAYIRNVCQVITKCDLTQITYDKFESIYNIMGAPGGIASMFPTTSDFVSYYSVTDSSMDDFKIVSVVNNRMVSPLATEYPSNVSYAVMHHIAKDCYPGILITQAFGTRYVDYLVAADKVYTTSELSNVDCVNDSILNIVANLYNKDGTFVHVDSLPLSNAFEYITDLDSIPEHSIVEEMLKILRTHDVQLSGMDALKHLEPYGVKFPKSLTATDPTLIRETYADDAYAQELYTQVKPYYDTFDLHNLNANLVGFSNGAIYSMAFVGESGTGKSTAARVIPYRCGFPYISVNFSVNIEESDLFGTMVPNTEKKNAEDPEFVWQDGIITKAVRNGYTAILEELNFARPGVLGKLNSLLDENRQLDLPNGEIVKAHPNFRIIVTCNIAYEGTNRFNKALVNRFDDVTVFKDLVREEAIDIIKNRTGYTNMSRITTVYSVYEALKKFAHEQNLNLVVSIRQLINIFAKGKYYENAKDAITRIMLNGAFLEDAEYQKVFEDTVLPAFDLRFKI